MKNRWKKIFGVILVLVCGIGIGLFAYQNSLLGRTHQVESTDESLESSEVLSSSVSSEVSQEPIIQAATLTDFLRHAIEPKDQVLYVWGGGWNEDDTGGNEDSMTIGLVPSWKEFYEANKNGYVAEEHIYEIHNGLDCSGYVGWVLYNTLPNKQDYVSLSETYGDFLSKLGYGTYKTASEVTEVLPGDLMMTNQGHIYIALGQFEDGSVLLMHSSPPGVRMSGTPGIAYQTALLYQDNGWNPLVDASYLNYDQFRFNESTLSDPDHLREMPVARIIDFLYEDPNALDANNYSHLPPTVQPVEENE